MNRLLYESRRRGGSLRPSQCAVPVVAPPADVPSFRIIVTHAIWKQSHRCYVKVMKTWAGWLIDRSRFSCSSCATADTPAVSPSNSRHEDPSLAARLLQSMLFEVSDDDDEVLILSDDEGDTSNQEDVHSGGVARVVVTNELQ